MGEEQNLSVGGTWLGNYYYDRLSQPCGFEAVFAEQGGVVDGSILDDGNLGEALVVGSFAFPRLQFQKRYDNPAFSPILYEGTMSDDGKRLSGTWRITEAEKGTWTAWRVDGEELPAQEETESEEQEVVRERVLVERAPRRRDQTKVL
jgi:hypothetical protein